jgi:anti-sigma factor RsiW
MSLRSSRQCDRTRVLASMRLDGPLSELDRRALEAHRARCPECAAVIEGIGDVTARVRSSQRVEPPALAVPGPGRVRARGRARWAAGVTAAVAAAAWLGVIAGSGSEPAPTAPRPAPILVAERTDSMRMLTWERAQQLSCQLNWIDCRLPPRFGHAGSP